MLHTHGLVKFGPYFTFMKSLHHKIKLAFILPNYSPKTRIGPHDEDVYSVLVGAILGHCYALLIFKKVQYIRNIYSGYLIFLLHLF